MNRNEKVEPEELTVRAVKLFMTAVEVLKDTRPDMYQAALASAEEHSEVKAKFDAMPVELFELKAMRSMVSGFLETHRKVLCLCVAVSILRSADNDEKYLAPVARSFARVMAFVKINSPMAMIVIYTMLENQIAELEAATLAKTAESH